MILRKGCYLDSFPFVMKERFHWEVTSLQPYVDRVKKVLEKRIVFMNLYAKEVSKKGHFIRTFHSRIFNRLYAFGGNYSIEYEIFIVYRTLVSSSLTLLTFALFSTPNYLINANLEPKLCAFRFIFLERRRYTF